MTYRTLGGSATSTSEPLPVAVTIDATNDYLAIYTASAAATQAINRNTLLGITGSPVGTTDSQALTNKTVGNTNTVTLKDTLFTLQDDGDTTKQARFQLSGITTATTRIYTLPDASDTLVTLGAAQTLTNKTFTSPTINTAIIANPTLTVDTISEYTSTHGVIIDGVTLKDGAVGANGVVTASITDAAVTPAKLVAGTGTTWAWQTWAPSWTNFTIGNGTVNYARYIQTGKTTQFRLKVTLGSTSAVTGLITFSLPVNFNSDFTSVTDTVNTYGNIRDSSTGDVFIPWVNYASSSTASISFVNSASNQQATSSSAPMTWATGDIFMVIGTYEAA